MTLPKISIITPNYNGDKYLEETILSVINQNYPNLEYIIIDGGSNDSSVEIIKKYQDKITHWISEPDKGLYNALNKGFSLSTGDIMGWINSDDKLHPNCLSILAKTFFEKPNIHWIQGKPNTIDVEGNFRSERAHFYLRHLFYLRYFNLSTSYLIQQESTFWRRSLWTKAGSCINEKYKLAGDFELWIRFFRHARLYNIKDYLGTFRINPNQLSSDINHYLSEANDIINKEFKVLPIRTKFEIQLLRLFYKFNLKHKVFKKLLYPVEMKKNYFIN